MGDNGAMATEILNGNELIVQGALEAGFDLYTGYPGSPLADYFNILEHKKERLKSRGIQVAIANSEANAAAMASGAKQAGRNCLVAMKSMGLNVAADALSVGNFARPGEDGEGPPPGVVVVVGDDPWSISTSAPVDSRYLFKHLHIPFLEPSTPQELKDWIKVALEISRASSVYQGILLTTFMAEGGGRVQSSSWSEVQKERTHLDSSSFDLQKLVMVPPNSLIADQAMILERFPRVQEVLGRLKLDCAYGATEASVGFISSGATFETLKQVLEDSNSLCSVGLYKVACPWPLEEGQLLPWLEGKKIIVVVEEKRGFLEAELSHLISRKDLDLKIYGKKFDEEEGFPAHGGLSADIIEQKIARWISSPKVSEPLFSWETKLPMRFPTFLSRLSAPGNPQFAQGLAGEFGGSGVGLAQPWGCGLLLSELFASLQGNAQPFGDGARRSAGGGSGLVWRQPQRGVDGGLHFLPLGDHRHFQLRSIGSRHHLYFVG